MNREPEPCSVLYWRHEEAYLRRPPLHASHVRARIGQTDASSPRAGHVRRAAGRTAAAAGEAVARDGHHDELRRHDDVGRGADVLPPGPVANPFLLVPGSRSLLPASGGARSTDGDGTLVHRAER